MEKYVEETVVRVSYCCDVCQQPAEYRCEGCRKDLCKNHSAVLFTSPWTGEDAGNYPDAMCDECCVSATEIGKKTQAILDEARNRADAIKQQWYRDRGMAKKEEKS